jgi:hypothetical protein
MRTRSLLGAAAAALSSLSFAPIDSSVPALDVFVECKCVGKIELEFSAPDILPWAVVWQYDDQHQDGICDDGYCSQLYDPRPCNVDAKVTVGWAAQPGGGLPPFPPCATPADAVYDDETGGPHTYMGQMNAAQVTATQRHVGLTILDCKTKEKLRPDDRTHEGFHDHSHIRISCADANGYNFARKITLKEVCVGCEGAAKK